MRLAPRWVRARCWASIVSVAMFILISVPGVAWAEPLPWLQPLDPSSLTFTPGEPFEVAFTAGNNGSGARTGSLTIFFPGDPGVFIVDQSELPPGPDSYARVFEPGDEMYHFGLQRNVPIQSRAVELYATPWPTGQQHWVRVQITAWDRFEVLARVALRDSRFFTYPVAGSPAGYDTQGAPVARWEFSPSS